MIYTLYSIYIGFLYADKDKWVAFFLSQLRDYASFHRRKELYATGYLFHFHLWNTLKLKVCFPL